MIEQRDGSLAVSGPMTVDTATALASQGAALAAQRPSDFDLTGVTKVDSAAVGVVLEWIRAAKGAGHGLRLNGVPDSFASLMRLYGVEEILTPYLSEA